MPFVRYLEIDFTNFENLHKDLVEFAQEIGRSVIVLMIDFNDETNNYIIREAQARSLNYLICSGDSNEDVIRNNAIRRSFELYDVNYHYGVMIYINDTLVSGGFISFSDPDELWLVVIEGLDYYQNN